MARLPGLMLPDATVLGEAPNMRSGRQIPDYSGGEAAGQAIVRGTAALAEGLNTLGAGLRVQERADTQLDLARADAHFLVQSKTIKDELGNDQNDDGLTERYGKRYRETLAQAAELIRDPRAREMFRLKRADDVTQGEIAASDRTFKIGQDKALASTSEQLRTLRESALQEKDEASRTKFIDTGARLLAGLRGANYISAQEEQRQRAAWVKDYTIASIEMLPAQERINLLRGQPVTREETLDRIERIESGGDPTARSQLSSATGAFQFTRDTWLNTIKAAKPDLVKGKSDDELLELRNDRKLSRELAGQLLDQNGRDLRSAGVPVDSGTLYLAHFLGATDAIKVLKAEPGTPVADILGRKVIAANKGVLFGKTTDSVIDWAKGRMGGTPQQVASFIPADKLNEMREKAEGEVARNNAQRDASAERQRKALGDEAMKEAWSLTSQGKLTPQFVEQIRPLVGDNDYKGLLKALRGEDATDDPEAIADLTRRLDTDDPETFQRDAVTYLGMQKLKTGTYISLSEKNRTASKDDRPESPYKSGRGLLRTTLDPGQLLSGPAAAVARSSQAQALTEYDNWAQANPRATREDHLTEAQNVIKRYQVVPFQEMKLATGTSRYFGGKGRDEVTIELIDGAEKALLDDITSGRLTKPQQEFEIRLLDNWRAILARETLLKQQGVGSGARR